MEPKDIHISRFYSAASPVPSPISPQLCARPQAPVFSQTELLFHKRLPPVSQPQDLAETDISPSGTPSEVDTCQLLSPLYHTPQPYYTQDYTQDQLDQQAESHPDESLQDYPFNFQQNHSRAYQSNLNQQPDQDKNQHVDPPSNLNQRQLQTHMGLDNTPNSYQDHPLDHQTPNSYQDHQMIQQAIYCSQESHVMEQQSLGVGSQLADPDDHQSMHSQQQSYQLRILAQLQREELVYNTPEPSEQSQTQSSGHMSYTPTHHQDLRPYMHPQGHADPQPGHCLYTQPPQSPLTPVEPTSPWFPSPQVYPNPNPPYSVYPHSPPPHPNSNSLLQTKYSPLPNPNPTYSPHPNHSPYSYTHLSPQSNASPHSNHPSSSPSPASPYAIPNPHLQSNHNYGLSCQPNTYPNPTPYYSPHPLPNSPSVLPCGGWGTSRGVGAEGGRGAHMSQLSYTRHLDHARSLCSPPAQQMQGTLTEQTENDEMSNCSRLLCSMCQRVFRSLPALNGHLRSHGGLRGQTSRTHTQRMRQGAMPLSPVPMVMPVSVPIRPSAPPAPGMEEGPEAEKDRRRWKKRDQYQPSPLVLPCRPYGNAGVFRGLLRSSGVTGAYTPGAYTTGAYTPAPMLPPEREGTGLFCSLSRAEGGLLKPEEQPAEMKPRINIGVGFQAEVPPLQDPRHAHADPHNAVMLWKPWDDLENPSTQHRVDCLLMMSCSSVCPGGGTNSEYALHSLSKSRGDFLETLEKMLLQPWLIRQSTTSYHYAGSDSWSPLEKRLVNKAFRMYKKDFRCIHSTVGSKSVSQCVEYYYTWKRRLRLNTPVKIPSALPEDNGGIMDREGLEVDSSLTNKKLSITRSPEHSEPTTNSISTLFRGGYDDKQGSLTQPSLNGQTGVHTTSIQNICRQIPGASFGPVLEAGPGSRGCSPVQQESDRDTHISGPGCLRASPSSASYSPTPNNSLRPPCFKRHPQPPTLYPCRECSKVFSKVKSRNAHMKTHRQQDVHGHMEQLD
ncbi:hypothetical protein DPEC_G00311750 [Dallia pectoralis]|uniref:Uncharacterized protein n=1 Tax=Dallia pectoralis TaxID=75939 RepID=A0ACC2FBG2_DALPE|nr:hypothetical protein DPEC_G00311750 [Dallia pectoralis]